MANLDEILQKYGREKKLSPGDVLIRQGAVSDGVYYLKSGRLGAYKKEQGRFYPLSVVSPGRLVGELGSTTGWARTATVRAEEESVVIHVPEADFHRALRGVSRLGGDRRLAGGEAPHRRRCRADQPRPLVPACRGAGRGAVLREGAVGGVAATAGRVGRYDRPRPAQSPERDR
jgi:hypothetical protein